MFYITGCLVLNGFEDENKIYGVLTRSSSNDQNVPKPEMHRFFINPIERAM